MQNYKMKIAYDGRNYMGFSTKKDKPEKSIQGKLEMILEKLYGQHVDVIGAVNTDAGVHAKAQIVNFNAVDDQLDAKGLFEYFEKYLPDDIIVLTIEPVDERFHSKYLVESITYEYRLWKLDAPNRPLFERKQVNVMAQKLNFPKMKQAAEELIGVADFSPFTTNKKVKNPIKEIKSVDITETDHEIIFTMTANGFLLNMERLIVGTIIQVGLNQLPVNTISNALTTKHEKYIGHKAMADALCLISVNY